MPMTKAGMKAKIMIELKTCNPDITAPIEALMNDCLEAICEGIINEIKANMTFTVANGDFNVLPGSFKDGVSLPVTGEGDNKAFALVGKMT